MTRNRKTQEDSLVVIVHSYHPLVFQLIQQAVASDPRLHCTVHFTAKSPSSVLLRPPSPVPPIFIVDTHSVRGWRESLLQLRSRECRTIVLVPDEIENGGEELKGLFLGAHGIVSMSANLTEDLPKAIRTVHKGRLWISRNALDEYVQRTNAAFSKLSFRGRQLTAREEHIVQFLVRGFPNKQIGKMLAISERTVKFHVSNIMRKLQVQSRRELLSLEELADAILSFAPASNSAGCLTSEFPTFEEDRTPGQHPYSHRRPA